jgi:hypothetical protein
MGSLVRQPLSFPVDDFSKLLVSAGWPSVHQAMACPLNRLTEGDQQKQQSAKPREYDVVHATDSTPP